MKKFYITTPIYYVNDVPHIGHAYTTLAADVLARYKRMHGFNVFFLTGTDEHGQKVEEAAQKRGITPKQHADETHIAFKELWKRLHISNTDFIRTTDKRHGDLVRDILTRLYKKGAIYKDSYEGWYCLSDERFWTEKDLDAGKCPDCGRKVEFLKEWNYFFRMGEHREWLIRYIKENPGFIKPETRKNEVLGFLDRPLTDLCISRPLKRLPWGIPLPFDPDYVTYVWFDALINYISAPAVSIEKEESNTWWPADHHLVGKDILTTHAVYWSTMLHAIGLPLPKNIFAHGWWTVNGEKMSKSRENFVSPHTLIDSYGVDAVRYFLMREVPFGADGDFSPDAIISRINTDLANNLGNLLSRTLNMTEKYFDGMVPEPSLSRDTALSLLTKGAGITGEFDTLMSSLSFSRALAAIWRLIDETNRYIDSRAPWRLAKTEEGKVELRDVLYNSLESLRIIACMITPFMPGSSAEMLDQLGVNDPGEGQGEKLLAWGRTRPGTKIRKGKHLFPRIQKEEKRIMSEENTQAQHKPEELSHANLISIDDFMKVTLLVGEIREAEHIKKSKKLMKLMVDIGAEVRQVVAGIAGSYSAEELVGKKVAIVSNLQPVTLMGVKSQGMLLAAQDQEGKLSLIGFDKKIDPGTRIK